MEWGEEVIGLYTVLGRKPTPRYFWTPSKSPSQA